MYFKLAAKNVKKSIKDFTIYFLTLTFGVCLFYVFNSIDSQQAMLIISNDQRDILQLMTQMLGYVSVFITVILGFLIIYANNFLIRRRKKELGLYMTLGMDRGKISRILIGETFFIGLFALAVGLILGVFASQGLSVLTAQLFGAQLRQFQFIFSPGALWKSVLYFGIIFVVVMIFNSIAVSRYQLIDLLYGGRRNEKLRVKNLWVSMILFLLSAACLGAAYHKVLTVGLMGLDGIVILLGCAGTLLFFLSLSGFLLRIVKTSKGLYYKGLNMFVLRQINSKITTNSVSMSAICIMLFIAICTLSCGAGMANTMAGDLSKTTPYDASFTYAYYLSTPKPLSGTLQEYIEQNGARLSDYASDYAEYTLYESDATYGQLATGDLTHAIKFLTPEGLEAMKKTPIAMISVSDFNRQMALQGKEPIALGDGQYAVVANYNQMRDILNDHLSRGGTVTVSGTTLSPAMNQALDDTLYTTPQALDTGSLIVPDAIAQSGKIYQKGLNLQYKGDPQQMESRFQQAIKPLENRYLHYNTKISIVENSGGLKAVIYYIALYVGIVFLLTSAAVLALQQLSESTDNVERYDLLQKIGAEKKMIHHALFWQILIYFMVPLTLALVHSYIGIKVSSETIELFGAMDIFQSTLFGALFILVVYGGYFLATYFGSKNIIANKKIR